LKSQKKKSPKRNACGEAGCLEIKRKGEDGFGSFLSRKEGCLVVRDREGNSESYPLGENEIGEIQVRSGNALSAGALTSCCFWGIDVVVLTSRGNPVGILHSLDNSSHVLTRVYQYETLKTVKALKIAKQLVLGKIRGQDQVLRKYSLRRNDYAVTEAINKLEASSLSMLQRQLNTIEGRYASQYFQQIFGILPDFLRPKNRTTFKAYDRMNNLFNLGYTVLSWKVHIALIRAKLEPYLGFLHSLQFGKPSLVCDFEELYRYLIDDFVIQYALSLREEDFVLKEETFSSNRKGKRQYLNGAKNKEFLKRLNLYFRSKVEIPRIKVGKKQEIETLIAEEALLFAKYLREETEGWNPRIVNLS
jgi:CRISPR-associated protein Cas1